MTKSLPRRLYRRAAASQALAVTVLVAAASLALAADVPVDNGDFEAGLSGWMVNKPDTFAHGQVVVTTDDVHGGKQAVCITNVPEGEKVLVGLSNVKAIPLPDDCRTFAVKLWMKALRAPQMIELRIASADREGKQLTPWQEKGWRFIRPPVALYVGEWREFTAEFVAQDEWGGVLLTLWCNGAGADLLVDDLRIETIDPEKWVVPGVGARLPDPAPGVALWWEGPLRKVYPGEMPPERRSTDVPLSAAGDECDVTQICLRPETDLPDLTASFSELTGPVRLPATALRANFVGLVDIKNVTSARGIRGPTPDPLLTDASLTLPGGRTTALWVTLRVPRGTPAGDYSGALTLTAPGFTARVPLRVRVFGFDLPERPTLRTIARIWQSHPGYESLFLQDLKDHRCAGSSYIGGITASVKDGALVVDVSKLRDALEARLFKYGFQVFNVPSVFLGDASGLYAKDKKWMGFDIFSPDFDQAFSHYCRQVGDALRAEGVLQYALWQIWDEPHDEMVAQCKHLARLVRQAVPDARIYLTTGVIDDMLDLVDIWCLPWPSTYSDQAAAKVRARGGELWAYENGLYSLDVADSSLLLRHFLWRLKRYGITGVEWWAVSQWKSDPWTVPNQYAPQNGGGFFLYPTPDRTGAPIDSLRWEMYREGVEDYDILTVLAHEQDRVLRALGVSDDRLSGEAQARELAARVALNVAEVSRDPLAADAARREACERIEFLRANPGAAVGVARDGKGPLVLVASGKAAVSVNGKALEGTAAVRQIRPRAGEPVTVRVEQAGRTKAVTLLAPLGVAE